MINAELEELKKHIPPDHPRFKAKDGYLEFCVEMDDDGGLWNHPYDLNKTDIEDCRNAAIAYWYEEMIKLAGTIEGQGCIEHINFWRNWRKS